MVQSHVADMALAVDAAALLVYRAAWAKDRGAERVSREAAMAKLFCSELAMDATLKAIHATGYDGWVTVELYPYIDNPDDAAREAREFLTKQMEALDIPVE